MDFNLKSLNDNLNDITIQLEEFTADLKRARDTFSEAFLQLSEIQRIQRELNAEQMDLKNRLKSIEAKKINPEDVVRQMDEILLPHGFVYIQPPGTKPPQDLWVNSTVRWRDITSDYAGLLFRAEGGDSEPFGKVQEEIIPQIIDVRYGTAAKGTKFPTQVKFPYGGWSSEIYIGKVNKNNEGQQQKDVKF